MPVVYDPERKWFFVHVNKAAGSSFWQVACKDLPRIETKNADGTENWSIHHQPAAHWLKHPQLKNYTPVSIIRNPWDRALSYYTFHTQVLCIKNMNDPYWSKLHSRLIREGFKGAWMPGGTYDVARHVPPQISYLDERSRYFRVEDQVNELLKFTGQTGMPKVNVSPRDRDYRAYYDDELKDRIATIFADDIKLGGYTF